ncbi:MAG TPA: SDR family oxidoreductase [Chlamydiales bacterium]|nr:SDR family oxidoreductase [Chlamydiales bacterium]
MKGIIVSATSDIATEMCSRWQRKGWDLCGTYCSQGKNYERLNGHKIPLVHCDLCQALSIDRAACELRNIMQDWDFLLFAAGSLAPVGSFEKIDIDFWTSSIQLNFVNQLRLLHRLLPGRNVASEKTVLFFAGGGTNNAVSSYSAYTLSKIALIKACELLNFEISDVKFSIIGPGWVKTKIHKATLDGGEKLAGNNFAKTKQKMNSNDCVPIDKVIESFEWILSQPKKVVGGRNFSTVFDQWGTEELATLLLQDENMYKLRRFKNDILMESL